mgnify:CR=1 FL=1
MQTTFIKTASILALLMLPAACGGGRGEGPNLMTLGGAGSGPDEFSVLPTRQLETPEDLVTLPTPTPGGTNITDPNPVADAVVALGGSVNALTPNGTVGADGALLSHASRFGYSPDIRAVTAAEDLEFRGRNRGRILERAFNVNVYFRKYRREALDQHAELARLRRAGIRTSSAPATGPEE